MSSTTQSRSRGRPRNAIVVVSLKFSPTATPRDSKQLQVKANKLGGKVITRTESEMIVHFNRKTAGMSASNFERAVKAAPFTSGIMRKNVDPYSA